MKIRQAIGCIGDLDFVLAARTASPKRHPAPTQVTDAAAERALLNQYCVTCHNQKLKTAGLELDKLDTAHVADHAEKWEKVVRKLRAGMMPPSGMPRPAGAPTKRWSRGSKASWTRTRRRTFRRPGFIA